MVLFFLFPARLLFGNAGLEEAKKPGGASGLRLIQIRLVTRVWQKSSASVNNISSEETLTGVIN
jgi:hypothetical protein